MSLNPLRIFAGDDTHLAPRDRWPADVCHIIVAPFCALAGASWLGAIWTAGTLAKQGQDARGGGKARADAIFDAVTAGFGGAMVAAHAFGAPAVAILIGCALASLEAWRRRAAAT